MRYKQWKIANPSPDGRARLEQAGISSLLACVLSARGVTEPEQAWKLLTPGEEPLLDPMRSRTWTGRSSGSPGP